MAEVKRAYRLLAKAFHPDSAGEAAIPRFLAIHAAYEQLKTGRVPAARTARAPQPAPAEPWRADPARARAARERARTGRTGSARTGPATGSGGAGGTAGTTRPGGRAGATGSSGASGSTGADGATGSAGATGASTGGRASTGTRGTGRRRDVRKATMGSTSYDEARDPSDATWSGASWYGPSSGEYWIVNPREYADPRKHGPEYQQRARRPSDDEPAEVIDGGSEAAAAEASGETSASEPSTDRVGGTTARGQAAGRTAQGWAAGAAPRAGAAARRAAAGTVGAAGPAGAAAAGTGNATGSAAASTPPPWTNLGETAPRSVPSPDLGEVRSWLGGPADDPIRRLGLALVAWPPIGLAAAAIIGDVTGCTAFAASCTGSEPMLPWLAQAGILGVLLLLPPVTRLLAGGAIAVLLALVPITAFLVALGGTGAPEAGPTLAVLLGVAWLLGVGWAAVSLRQRRAARFGP